MPTRTPLLDPLVRAYQPPFCRSAPIERERVARSLTHLVPGPDLHHVAVASTVRHDNRTNDFHHLIDTTIGKRRGDGAGREARVRDLDPHAEPMADFSRDGRQAGRLKREE